MQMRAFSATVALAVLAASSIAPAQAQQQNPQSQAAAAQQKAVTASPEYSKSMKELQRAAQRLRESIQKLAQQQPGPKRDRALENAREALFDTQQAMVQLPPELRQARPAVGGTGSVPSYDESMKRLTEASDRLYSALHSMAGQKAVPRRNEAMQQAREALFETEQAMLALPVQAATR